MNLKQLIIGSWNVRTLMDNPKADRPERRTALVARELARYHVDIAALSETRRTNEGQLTEDSGGYCFFLSGRTSEERLEAGVGFAITSHLVSKLASLPRGLYDPLMVMQLQLTIKQKATLISAYAPTVTNPEEVNDQLYEQLDALIAAVPKSEKLIILGDFNARVGTDHTHGQTVLANKVQANATAMASYSYRPVQSTNSSSLTRCSVYQPATRRPRSKHWHLIDYVITRMRDAGDVRVTKSMCGAECWTDHRLLVSKLTLPIQPQRRHQAENVSSS